MKVRQLISVLKLMLDIISEVKGTKALKNAQDHVLNAMKKMGVQNVQLMDLKNLIIYLISVLYAKKGIQWITQAHKVLMEFVLVLLKMENIPVMKVMFGVPRLTKTDNAS